MIRVATLPLLLLAAYASAQNYQLSPLFGVDGGVRVNVAAGGNAANAHVLQPDGKLLLAGYGYDIGLNSFHVSLMRLDTICGALDATFGNGGSVAHTHQQRTTCHNIALQPDGRVVGVGMIAPSNAGSQQKAGIFRFLPDGSVDSSFNGLGYNQALWDPVSSGTLWHAFINADSTITAVGNSSGNINGGVNTIGAMRFTYDGQFDPAFDGDGISTLPISASEGTGTMRPDGRVLAVGETFVNPNIHIVMAQFNTDGTPDTTFGTGGWIVTPVMINGNNDAGAMGVSLLPDGRILVSTSAPGSTDSFLMARFLPDGTVDSTYATNGVSVATINIGSSCAGRDHELLADGSTLQFGSYLGHGTILKRDADGQVVNGFGTNGFVEALTGFGSEEYRGGFSLPSGRIIGYGSYGNFMLAIRHTTDPASEGFVDLGADVALCEGVPVILDAGNPGSIFLWNDSSSAQTLLLDTTGIYSVIVTDANGCVDSDSVEVTLFALPPQPAITTVGFDLSTTAIGDLQWSFNGTPIPGATGSSYTATQNGSYTVTVTDANGCTNTSDPENVTGVGMVEMANEPIQLFPIPASDRLSISRLGGTAGMSATAIDGAGRRITLAWSDRSTLDIHALASGTYLLELRKADTIHRLRFVKN